MRRDEREFIDFAESVLAEDDDFDSFRKAALRFLEEFTS